jgi:hypothetical protein
MLNAIDRSATERPVTLARYAVEGWRTMRHVLLMALVAMLALFAPISAQAGSMSGPLTVLDKTFTFNPNDESGDAYDCFDVPYGVMLTVVVWTMEADSNDETVSFVLKEGDLTRLRTSLSTNPTVMAGYAGAGTYCYWISASHVHLDTIAPIRQARLTITADSDGAR